MTACHFLVGKSTVLRTEHERPWRLGVHDLCESRHNLFRRPDGLPANQSPVRAEVPQRARSPQPPRPGRPHRARSNSTRHAWTAGGLAVGSRLEEATSTRSENPMLA